MKFSTIHKVALRLSLIYTTITTVWVLFADRLSKTAVPEPGIVTKMQKHPGCSIFRAFLSWYLILAPMLLLVSCQTSPGNNALNGRITVWHSWTPAEVVELEAAFD